MVRSTTSFLGAALVLFLGASVAEARKPEDVFGGKILLSEKAFPTEARSANAYIASLRKQSKGSFWEDKQKQEWRIHYAAFFKKPLNDLEVTIKLYDVSDGARRMVESYEQYVDSRGQRAIIGDLKLKKGDGGYDANSRILMVMENHGSVIASVTFKIGGEGRHYSGKVTFTEEEANGNRELPANSKDK